MSIVGPRNALAGVAAPSMGWENGMNPELAAALMAALANPQMQAPMPPIGARPAPYEMQYVPAARSAFPGGYMWDPRGQAGAAFGAAPPQRAPMQARRPVSREMGADQLNALVLGALGGQAPVAQGGNNYGADQNIRRFMGY